MISMPLLKRYMLITTSISVDIAIYTLAYLVALSIRALPSSTIVMLNLPFIVLSALLFVTIFTLWGIYQRIWSRTSGYDVIHIIQASGLSFLILLIVNILLTPRPIPLSVFFVFHILALNGFVLVRYRLHLIGALKLRYRAKWLQEFPNGDTERVLIIGAGEMGQLIALRFRQHSDNNNYDVVGYLDDDPEKSGRLIENCKVLGSIDQVSQLVNEYQVNLLVVAIFTIQGPNFRRILSLCEATGARIKVVPDIFTLVENKSSSPPLRDVTPEDLIGRSIVTKHKDIDLSAISNRSVLVTGAAGSIGSEIARQILDYNPTKLILLDNNESALHDLHISLLGLSHSIEIIPSLVDVSQYKQLQKVYQQHNPDIVFHAAAYKHVPMLERYPNAAVRVNIDGTLNAVELALLNNVERFVLVSTDKAVAPSSVMGASKRLCELIVHEIASNVDYGNTLFATVRFGNVLGSRGSVVPTFERQIDLGGPVTVTDPEMTRYFMSISEATNLVIHAGAMTEGDDVFVLRMGEVVKIVELAERVIRLRGLRPYIDIPIEFSGIRAGEKLHEQLYEMDENPQSTKHPYITKVSAQGSVNHMTQFMGCIRNIVKEGIQDDSHALEELIQITKIVEYVDETEKKQEI